MASKGWTASQSRGFLRNNAPVEYAQRYTDTTPSSHMPVTLAQVVFVPNSRLRPRADRLVRA
jgi:hypothetical protein